jgi:hypothetical protein
MGCLAGETNQGTVAVAIGYSAGNINQGDLAIAIGFQAGQTNQGIEAIAIGARAGEIVQGPSAIAIGVASGLSLQGDSAIAIGSQSGQIDQGSAAIAIGLGAGQTNQGTEAIAIGAQAGEFVQGPSAIAIGTGAGLSTQGQNAVAIGSGVGQDTQGNSAIAIGPQAGQSTQGDSAIAIGNAAGFQGQLVNSIAIGFDAGRNNLAAEAIAIGNSAALNGAGLYSIAIGFQAENAVTLNINTIVLNAQGIALDSVAAVSTYVAPLRSANNGAGYPGIPIGTDPDIKYPDYLCSYDPVADIVNPTAQTVYEVTYGKHSMMLATYYMPYAPNFPAAPESVRWSLTSAQAISVPLTTDPFALAGTVPTCQKNIYNYYLYNCITETLSPLLIDGTAAPPLNTCAPGPILPNPFQARTCEGVYALLEDLTITFDQAAYLSVYWGYTNVDVPTINTINIEYSCSIEWFNDVRSDIEIDGKKFKVMLLGANHTF